MKRLLWIALAVLVVTGIAAPYLDIDIVRPKIQRALERALGRKVEVGQVHINLFTGPGFTLEDVTIHEDPRAGIEPFAHVWTLEARVRLLSLFSRRLEFSSLRLGAETGINLVKTDAGPWNFQFLLGSAEANAGTMPSIKMRRGRVNIKFGDTKSVFYFDDADIDVSPSGNGALDLRFSGSPARTDRSAQNFGHFFIRGRWSGERLDMRVELERSPLGEVARLMDRRGFGLHGVVAFDAQISGNPSHLDVAGQLQVDDIHRWDLLPKRGGGWQIAYKGTLDLHGERLELESITDAPVALKFRAWDYLSRPHWEAGADLKQIPLATLLEVARHMGISLAENLAADGSVSGGLRYSDSDGASGRVELQDASLTLPDAQPLRSASAAIDIGQQALSLETSTVRIGDSESADVSGTYSFDSPGGLDLKINTRGLSVADLRSFDLAAIPLLDQTPVGTWRGSARYHWTPGEEGEWSGEYELQNARINVDGLADPLRIHSAAVTLNGARVAVSRLRARVGDVSFMGDYRWEPAALRPHKFRITIPEVDLAELERILTPTLVRERGFLARTLRFGAAPLPEWLKTRRADGTVSVVALNLGDTQIRIDGARVLWDGGLVRLARLNAHIDPAAVTGDLAIDLSGRSPHYRFEGKLQDLAYKGGRVDLEGSLDADGVGAQLLTSARAEGRVHGRAIAFAPDADFRSIAGCFEMSGWLDGPRWRLSGLEIQQGGETYYGTGASQIDGRLVLDLASHGRQIRYTSVPPTIASQQ